MKATLWMSRDLIGLEIPRLGLRKGRKKKVRVTIETIEEAE